MNNISCSLEGENLYLFDYRDDITDGLGDAFGIDFTRERLSHKNIKKYWLCEKNLNFTTSNYQITKSAIRCKATFADSFFDCRCVKVEIPDLTCNKHQTMVIFCRNNCKNGEK